MFQEKKTIKWPIAVAGIEPFMIKICNGKESFCEYAEL